MALVIHRAWSKLGFKIWTWLAWLLTFNFVNIAWIFFRAKEWDDAIKVLSSMFSLDNIVLPNLLTSKFIFLDNLGVQSGAIYGNILGDTISTSVWLLMGFVTVLLFNNSIKLLDNFKFNFQTLLFSTILISMALLSMNKVSEFLYFNF